jgi:hypothetical protein
MSGRKGSTPPLQTTYPSTPLLLPFLSSYLDVLMKLTLRPEWRLWPLASFLGLLDLKTGVTVALLFAVRLQLSQSLSPLHLNDISVAAE